MTTATDYRTQAAACRRASKMGRRPALYLLDLAEYFDWQAAQLEAQYAGNKPGGVGTHDTEKENPRR
jgi:hypothetical protein